MIIFFKHPQAPLQGAALDTYLLKHVNGLKGELVVTGPGRTMGFCVPHSPNHRSQGTFFLLFLSGKKIRHKRCPGQWEVGDEGDRGPVFVRPRGHPQGGQTSGGSRRCREGGNDPRRLPSFPKEPPGGEVPMPLLPPASWGCVFSTWAKGPARFTSQSRKGMKTGQRRPWHPWQCLAMPRRFRKKHAVPRPSDINPTLLPANMGTVGSQDKQAFCHCRDTFSSGHRKQF